MEDVVHVYYIERILLVHVIKQTPMLTCNVYAANKSTITDQCNQNIQSLLYCVALIFVIFVCMSERKFYTITLFL